MNKAKSVMKNEIIDDLNSRYTTKKYDPSKKIPKEKLDILYEAMRLSASSINSQPWKFIVLKTQEAKQRMFNTFKNKHQFNQQHVIECDQVILFAHNPYYTLADYTKVIEKYIQDGRITEDEKQKAFGSFVFAQINSDSSGCNENWTKAQLYLALGNTLHTLARLKIDSTPLEGIDVDLVAKEFEDELKNYHCHVALAIGYHHEVEDFNFKLPKSRLSHDDIFVHL